MRDLIEKFSVMRDWYHTFDTLYAIGKKKLEKNQGFNGMKP